MEKNRIPTLFLLALLSAFPPLSTDMYLPALPLLQELWHQPETTVNLTLSAFFMGFCLSMLFYGPISDRFGRRPPLLVGISLYIIASLLSILANHVYVLIFLRGVQGIGAAAGMVMSMAITRDLFEGHERQKILGYIGVIMALAPMLAPVLGGVILAVLSWHWVFIAQAIMGGTALVGVIRMKEPLKERNEGSLIQVMKMYLSLFRNPGYLALVGIFSIVVLPHFSFIGAASNVYIKQFGTTEQLFSLYFAFNALAIMAGSFTCTRVQNRIKSETLLTLGFSGIFTAGIFMHADMVQGPWGLALPMALASFCFGLSRPPSNHLILQQVEKNAGTASSLMVFLYFMVASFATWFISLGWGNTIHMIGKIAILSNGVALLCWLIVKGKIRFRPSA